MPSYIIGKWSLAQDPATLATGSNGIALSNILDRTLPSPVYGITVHVADVARVHVEAMTNAQIKTHEDFVLNENGTEGVVWTDVIAIAKEHFSKAVEEGILPLGGNTQTARRKVDGSKAEKVFGLKMIGFEEQVVSLFGQYVELSEEVRSRKGGMTL